MVAQATSFEQLLETIQSLTDKQRQVLMLLLDGDTNKGVARKLGCSMRTVECYRQRFLEDTNTSNLVQLAYLLGTYRLRTVLADSA